MQHQTNTVALNLRNNGQAQLVKRNNPAPSTTASFSRWFLDILRFCSVLGLRPE